LSNARAVVSSTVEVAKHGRVSRTVPSKHLPLDVKAYAGDDGVQDVSPLLDGRADTWLRIQHQRVLFELIGARYERRSILITANQPFGEWGKVLPNPAMTLAAVDRLVHHAKIFGMNVEGYRRRAALDRKRGPGRPPTRATTKTAP
jgi:hypothetical protein